MHNNIHIGCSSFYNLSWKGIFYPDTMPKSKWFEHYCSQFNTYEINGTFYKFPTLKVMENWFNKTPEDFIFSVKVPKTITHLKKFNDCEELIKDFYAIVKSGLQYKLGCILFQLPPSYHYSPEKLEQIIQNLDQSFNNVIEFRHESWWIPEVWDKLSLYNITFCSVSHPTLPETIIHQHSSIYFRLHGNEKMFYSQYSVEELIDFANIIIEESKKQSVFIYFNNTATAAGVINALEMKKLIL